MKAYIFPGQGAQFTGMGLDLYEKSPVAQELFEKANSILGSTTLFFNFEASSGVGLKVEIQSNMYCIMFAK